MSETNAELHQREIEQPDEHIDVLADQLLGKTLASRYKIRSVIGDGGYGRVYLADHLTLEIPVAVKVLHQHLAQDKDRLKRLDQEAKVLSRVSSDFLVKTLDFGLSPIPFIVMEFVEGDTLSAWMKNHESTVQQSIEVFEQIAKGLSAAHSIGLIHRDLKPGNVLIKQSGEQINCKILDFGIAKVMDDSGSGNKLTSTGEILGSPAYMSPEQWTARAIDGRSDIYSLGCVMYEFITGIPVYEAATSFEYLNLHLQENFKPFSKVCKKQISPELEKIVMKCAMKDPNLRYQKTDEIIADLQRIKAGQTLKIKLPKAKEPDGAKTKRIMLASAITSISVALIGGSYFAYTERDNIYTNICSSYLTASEKQERDGQFDNAIKTLQSAKTIADFLPKQNKERLKVLRALTKVLKEHGSFAESEALEKLIKQEIGDVDDKPISALINQSAVQWELRGNGPLAVQYANAAMTQVQRYGKHSINYAECLQHFGALRRELKQLRVAEAMLTDALKTFEDLLDPLDKRISGTLNDLSLVILRQDRPAEAEVGFKRAAALAESNKDPHIGRYYNNLCTCYVKMKQYEKALAACKHAMEIERSINGDMLSNITNNIGTIYFHLKEYNNSVKYFKETLAIWESDGRNHHRSGEETLFNLAMVYKTMKDYKNAVHYFNLALQDKEKNEPNSSLIPNIKNQLSQIQSLQGENKAPAGHS